MSNFQPSKEVLEMWCSTRKSRHKLGDNFYHPRIFSTVDYKIDRNWFLLAFFIEISSLLIAIFFTGFNPFIIIGAIGASLFDVLCAIWLHGGQKYINKFRCKLELTMYEGQMEVIDDRTFRTQKETYKRAINAWENKRYPLIVIIILIAIVKCIFSFIALFPYGLIAFVVPLFFFLAAYIHIKHTGYWWAERKFLKQYEIEEAKFHFEDANNKLKGSKYFIDNSTPFQFNNLPDEVKDDFHKKYLTFSDHEKQRRRINRKHKQENDSSNIIIYGENAIHKIIYDEQTGVYFLSAWGSIKDNDLFELIEESGMRDSLKSYIGYCGLKEQKFEEPSLPNKNKRNHDD